MTVFPGSSRAGKGQQVHARLLLMRYTLVTPGETTFSQKLCLPRMPSHSLEHSSQRSSHQHVPESVWSSSRYHTHLCNPAAGAGWAPTAPLPRPGTDATPGVGEEAQTCLQISGSNQTERTFFNPASPVSLFSINEICSNRNVNPLL